MENIINKAIKGGYKKAPLLQSEWVIGFYKDCVLDPLFWQALGKTCGWKKVYDDPKLCGFVGKDWKDYALQFHETNLTQGFDKAVQWLEELVTLQK